MAGLRDANGRIVIDEAEAEAEAKKIEQAKAKLEQAQKLLDPAKLDSEHMRGETLDALEDTLSKLSKDFKLWEEKCGSTAQYIRTVVKKYQRIDREYAAKIKGAGGN